MKARNALFLALLVLTLSCPTAHAQEKVFKSLTADQMEQILRGMSLDYKKVPSRTEGVFYYDFTQNKKSLRLHFFQGKDLMLDVLFKDFTLETLNQWNTKAKFSRAALHKDDKGPYTALESNLDVLGGITEGTIQQFFKVFYTEIQDFEKFVGISTPVAPVVQKGDDRILPNLTPEKVEAIFKNLNLAFKKQPLKGQNSFFYDYESKNFKVRLYFYNGRDLMLDAVFKKLPLEKVNQYNFDRKFIRTVLYTNNDGSEYTSLECNMDCTAGVSENMVQHFLVTFDEEIQAFATFVNKNS
jgi:hypothetical protein